MQQRKTVEKLFSASFFRKKSIKFLECAIVTATLHLYQHVTESTSTKNFSFFVKFCNLPLHLVFNFTIFQSWWSTNFLGVTYPSKVRLLSAARHHSKSFFVIALASVDFILNKSSSSMDLRTSTKASRSLAPAM